MFSDVDRLVIDKSGFAEPFDVVLDCARAADPAASGPTIFAALEEQLGLCLKPTSASIEVLVIGRVERPIEQ